MQFNLFSLGDVCSDFHNLLVQQLPSADVIIEYIVTSHNFTLTCSDGLYFDNAEWNDTITCGCVMAETVSDVVARLGSCRGESQ